MKLILTLSLFISFSLHAASPKSVQCNNGFARIGDSKWSIIEKCGQPTDKEVVSGEDAVKQQQLVYPADKYPAHDFVVFTFSKNNLIKIELSN